MKTVNELAGDRRPVKEASRQPRVAPGDTGAISEAARVRRQDFEGGTRCRRKANPHSGSTPDADLTPFGSFGPEGTF